MSRTGLIAITVPNDFSRLQQVVVKHIGKPEWWVAPREHLNYFCSASLRRLVERLGYRVLQQTGSFPMELFMLLGDDYLASPDLGRVVHQKRVALETVLVQAGCGDLKAKVYSVLLDMGLGREFTLVAQSTCGADRTR